LRAKTIRVDGDLADWQGVLPQTTTGAGIGVSMSEEAYLPFKQFSNEQKAGVATAYLAYDERNFYFAAKIADDTPDEGMVRTVARDDDEYFYPEVSWDKDKALQWPAACGGFHTARISRFRRAMTTTTCSSRLTCWRRARSRFSSFRAEPWSILWSTRIPITSTR